MNIHSLTLTKARIWIQKFKDYSKYRHKTQKWKFKHTRKVWIQEKISQKKYDVKTLKNKCIEKMIIGLSDLFDTSFQS